MKRICLLLLFTINTIAHTPVQAQEMQREEIFNFLEDAFQAQLSLTEEFRSMEEIEEILSPYFTSSYTEKFLDEHLYVEGQSGKIFGSDVFAYFVPFFSYDQSTKIIKTENQILVYEFFEDSFDGPVIWYDHYEGMVLNKTNNGWKISEFIYSGQAPTIEDLSTDNIDVVE